ncbi:hypothetical protein ACF0H5_000845 [Mactra antiquata]
MVRLGRFNPLFRILIFCQIFSFIWCFGDFSLPAENGTELKTCDNRFVFKQFYQISLPGCVEECFRRQRCKWLMYRHGMNYCALKDFVNVTELDERQPRCLYISVDQWEVGYPDLGPCNNHTCGNDSRCTNTTENDYICEKSECLPPDEIDHAVILSNTHAIGTTNRYRCNPGYDGIGLANITCDSNATWSTTEFVCKIRCPNPSKSYFNGDLIYIDGPGFVEGTVLHFECKSGYQKTGLTATSTCQADGRWIPYRVACCHVNSTDFWTWDCIKIIDVGNASSNIEASNHCKNFGGHWRWFGNRMTNRVIASNSDMAVAIEPRYKTQFDKEWNYTACAIANDASVTSAIGLDAGLREARTNGWSGDECWGLLGWAPGQPDGGLTENCVYYLLYEKLFYDAICTFDSSITGFACGFSLPYV